ncbi:MAG: ATP-dependent zinc metalloprotease FtsH [Candidatus Latescibacterota bacterium]
MEHNGKTYGSRGPDGQPPDPQAPGVGPIQRRVLWALVGAVLAVALWGELGDGVGGVTRVEYSTFRRHLEAGDVQGVVVRGQRITGHLESPGRLETGDGTVEYRDFVTHIPSFGDPQLMPLLQEHRVKLRAEPDSPFGLCQVLIGTLPWLLMVWLGYALFRRLQSQGQSVFQLGRSRARLFDESQKKITFDDVAGVQGAKRELQEIAAFLDNPTRFSRLGAKTPKGVLLVGAPGTGKTLLARAVAGEAGVPFFSISGSDFMEMFVGVGASRVRDVFREARKRAPVIVFIDELDSIGRRRGTGLGGGHDEREQTLNQLLAEMDGFEPNDNVIVMAATNRPDTLDPALLRPGRFDRRVTVNLPTLPERVEVLRIHARNKPLAADVDLEALARGMPGSSGADLGNVLNEAAMIAARQDKQRVERADVDEARDKVLLGLERESLVMTERECRMVAYHEAGHAVLAAVLENTDPLYKVSIVPRGLGLGVTQQVPERDIYVYPKPYLEDRLAVMMGGRAAEELVLGTPTSGAENDLREATRMARKMVVDWGMSERLGPMTRSSDRDEVFLGEDLVQRREFSEWTAREVDQEVRAILEGAYTRACTVLREHRAALDRLAAALLEHEELQGEEVLEILREEPVTVGAVEALGLPLRRGP